MILDAQDERALRLLVTVTTRYVEAVTVARDGLGTTIDVLMAELGVRAGLIQARDILGMTAPPRAAKEG